MWCCSTQHTLTALCFHTFGRVSPVSGVSTTAVHAP